MNWEPLIEEARSARLNAYAPYSGFSVGAALLTEDGSVFFGCNVENRSFGITLCAERVAAAVAVASGQTSWRALVVVTETTPPSRPCGVCLQTLAEFNPQLPILLANLVGFQEELRLDELLPQPFSLPPGE